MKLVVNRQRIRSEVVHFARRLRQDRQRCAVGGPSFIQHTDRHIHDLLNAGPHLICRAAGLIEYRLAEGGAGDRQRDVLKGLVQIRDSGNGQ